MQTGCTESNRRGGVLPDSAAPRNSVWNFCFKKEETSLNINIKGKWQAGSRSGIRGSTNWGGIQRHVLVVENAEVVGDFSNERCKRKTHFRRKGNLIVWNTSDHCSLLFYILYVRNANRKIQRIVNNRIVCVFSWSTWLSNGKNKGDTDSSRTRDTWTPTSNTSNKIYN